METDRHAVGTIPSCRLNESALLAKLLITVAIGALPASMASANVVGSDTQNFNPIPSGIDFVTVHSSETLAPGIFNLGLFANHAVNSLPHFKNSAVKDDQGRLRYKDAITGVDLNVGLGLLPNWEVGFSMPQLVYQDVKTKAYHGEFKQRGGTEYRLMTKLRLWGDDDHGVAAIASANFNRIRNNPYLGSGAGPTYNLEMAADTRLLGAAVAVNVGYRWRHPGKPIESFPIKPFKDQYLASVAASYLVPSIDTKIIAEIYASHPVTRIHDGTGNSGSSAELLVGAKFDYTTNLALHVGGGTKLNDAYASPDWRAYVGLNYAMGPVFPERAPVFEEPAPEPQAPPPKQQEYTMNIHFATNSADVSHENDLEQLEKLADILKRDKAVNHIVVEGHTDSVGSASYNLKLSQRRADEVRSVLVTRYGVSAAKVEAIGYGETRPIADNGNYQGRQMNRRVVVRIFRN